MHLNIDNLENNLFVCCNFVSENNNRPKQKRWCEYDVKVSVHFKNGCDNNINETKKTNM